MVFCSFYLSSTLALYLQQTPKGVCLARANQFLVGATVLSGSPVT